VWYGVVVVSFPPFLYCKRKGIIYTRCWKESFGRGNEWTRSERKTGRRGVETGKGEEEVRYLTRLEEDG